jgi:hypothetical protein
MSPYQHCECQRLYPPFQISEKELEPAMIPLIAMHTRTLSKASSSLAEMMEVQDSIICQVKLRHELVEWLAAVNARDHIARGLVTSVQ